MIEYHFFNKNSSVDTIVKFKIPTNDKRKSKQ